MCVCPADGPLQLNSARMALFSAFSAFSFFFFFFSALLRSVHGRQHTILSNILKACLVNISCFIYNALVPRPQLKHFVRNGANENDDEEKNQKTQLQMLHLQLLQLKQFPSSRFSRFSRLSRCCCLNFRQKADKAYPLPRAGRLAPATPPAHFGCTLK